MFGSMELVLLWWIHGNRIEAHVDSVMKVQDTQTNEASLYNEYPYDCEER
jgi:hypothetical protein